MERWSRCKQQPVGSQWFICDVRRKAEGGGGLVSHYTFEKIKDDTRSSACAFGWIRGGFTFLDSLLVKPFGASRNTVLTRKQIWLKLQARREIKFFTDETFLGLKILCSIAFKLKFDGFGLTTFSDQLFCKILWIRLLLHDPMIVFQESLVFTQKGLFAQESLVSL